MRERTIVIVAAIMLAGAPAGAFAAEEYMRSAAPETRTLTPQQQKLKNCGTEWQAMKREGRTAGITWASYRRDCLRKP
jgi:hypothetical protein